MEGLGGLAPYAEGARMFQVVTIGAYGRESVMANGRVFDTKKQAQAWLAAHQRQLAKQGWTGGNFRVRDMFEDDDFGDD